MTHCVLVYNMFRRLLALLCWCCLVHVIEAKGSTPAVGIAICSTVHTLVVESDGTMWFDSVGHRSFRMPTIRMGERSVVFSRCHFARGFGMAHVIVLGSIEGHDNVVAISSDSGHTFRALVLPDSLTVRDCLRSSEPSRWWLLTTSGSVWFIGSDDVARPLTSMAKPQGEPIMLFDMATHGSGAAIVPSGVVFTETSWRSFKRNRLPAGIRPQDVQSITVAGSCLVLVARDTVYQAQIHVPRWVVHDSLQAARSSITRTSCVATGREGRVHLLNDDCSTARPLFQSAPLAEGLWEFAPGLVVAWREGRIERYGGLARGRAGK